MVVRCTRLTVRRPFPVMPNAVDGPKVRNEARALAITSARQRCFGTAWRRGEKKHIVDAFSFELNMVETKAVKERVLNELLVNVADELAKGVAAQTGLSVSAKRKTKRHDRKSAALSMDKPSPGIKGQKVAILAADGVAGAQIAALKAALDRRRRSRGSHRPIRRDDQVGGRRRDHGR